MLNVTLFDKYPSAADAVVGVANSKAATVSTTDPIGSGSRVWPTGPSLAITRPSSLSISLSAPHADSSNPARLYSRVSVQYASHVDGNITPIIGCRCCVAMCTSTLTSTLSRLLYCIAVKHPPKGWWQRWPGRLSPCIASSTKPNGPNRNARQPRIGGSCGWNEEQQQQQWQQWQQQRWPRTRTVRTPRCTTRSKPVFTVRPGW